jgi:hypothetical protein
MTHSHLTFIMVGMLAAAAVPAGGQAARTEWPDQAYRVEWEESHLPEEMAASAKIAIPVTVRNNGDRAWPESQVFISYHWFRDDRLVVWDGMRTPLPRDLRPGSRAALSVRVATPHEPGSYVLMVTLVHEQVAWFEHKGATTVVRPVVIRPATQVADFGSGTATSCTAAQ